MPRPPIAFVCKFVGDIRRIRSAGRATRIATLGFLAERSARIFADPIAPNDLACLVLVPAVLAGLSNFTGFWGRERAGESMGAGCVTAIRSQQIKRPFDPQAKAVSEHAPLAALSSKERATDGRWQVLVA